MFWIIIGILTYKFLFLVLYCLCCAGSQADNHMESLFMQDESPDSGTTENLQIEKLSQTKDYQIAHPVKST